MSEGMDIEAKLSRYVPFRLEPDLRGLSRNERELLPLLRQAADAMDLPYWIQEYGEPAPLLASIPDDRIRKAVRINYGPWDRLAGGEPLLPGVGPKPPGANYYPVEMTRAEFEAGAAQTPAMRSPYTMIRRDRQGELAAIPYHAFFSEHLEPAAESLRRASALAHSTDLARFLALRAEALLTDDFRASEIAWMELRDGNLGLLIGPLEIEDRLFGIKTAYAATLYIKQKAASAQISTYVGMLPHFQESLPVEAVYKQERPGLNGELLACEAAYFSGNDACYLPAGVAWPDDEEVQLGTGVRFLLITNVMQAKFEALFPPLADIFLAEEQRALVRYDARVDFVIFHELAHALGPRFTIHERRPVRVALGDLHHALEEGKADLVSLHLAGLLNRQGRLSDETLSAFYVTSLVSLLYNWEARQSLARLNFFIEKGAYSRDRRTGTYRVHPEQMRAAVEELAGKLLRLQGDGDYAEASAFFEQYGTAGDDVLEDLERLGGSDLPLGLMLER